MRTRILTASAAAVATAATVAILAAPGTEAAATKTVKVEDYQFAPAKLTVKPRTKVRFAFTGMANHNVTLIKGPGGVKRFSSADMDGGAYAKTLTRKGTYRITCTIHATAMRMTITVR